MSAADRIVDRPPEKPLITAVEGRCLGGGLEIALACDLIVAAEDAAFGLPEVRRGLTAAGGGMVRLPHRLPRNVALEPTPPAPSSPPGGRPSSASSPVSRRPAPLATQPSSWRPTSPATPRSPSAPRSASSPSPKPCPSPRPSPPRSRSSTPSAPPMTPRRAPAPSSRSATPTGRAAERRSRAPADLTPSLTPVPTNYLDNRLRPAVRDARLSAPVGWGGAVGDVRQRSPVERQAPRRCATTPTHPISTP